MTGGHRYHSLPPTAMKVWFGYYLTEANPNSEDNDGRTPLGWTPSPFKSEVKRKARATTFCCSTIRATTICSRKARAITTAGLGHVDQERLDARLTIAHSSPRVVQSFSTTKICSTTKRCGIGRCGLDIPQGQSPIVHSC
jgi:hypothetical protein